MDIGANIGYYALLEAKIAKKGKIYAIEPIDINCFLLTESITLNSSDNITLFSNLALSDTDDEKEIYFYNKYNWSSFTLNPSAKLLKKKKISTISLDEFIAKTNFHPTVIRMDVEGHEYEIFKGGINTLKRAKKLKIFVELHSFYLTPEKIEFIIDILQRNNFKIISVFKEPPPYIYRFRKIFNYIYKKANLPIYGKIEISNYKDLKEYLIKFNVHLECFFVKNVE